MTGNETCSIEHDLEQCDFTIQRYLMESTEHTIIVIIKNEVSKKVTPVTITVYKGTLDMDAFDNSITFRKIFSQKAGTVICNCGACGLQFSCCRFDCFRCGVLPTKQI